MVTFGLSTLHAWIRFFECLLHISYKLDVQKSQRSKECAEQIETRKKRIQHDFKEKLGLLVDFPRQEGSGNSNDGNTARRFFQAATISAEITGIDITLIKKFHVILQVISSGRTVDVEKFDVDATKTADLFVKKYGPY